MKESDSTLLNSSHAEASPPNPSEQAECLAELTTPTVCNTAASTPQVESAETVDELRNDEGEFRKPSAPTEFRATPFLKKFGIKEAHVKISPGTRTVAQKKFNLEQAVNMCSNGDIAADRGKYF